MSEYRLGDRAVLMRLSAALPGQNRKDPRTTAEVQTEKHLGNQSGNWVQRLYPEGALDAIKKKLGEARTYHLKVTFPFGGSPEEEEGGTDPIRGIGILPAGMITEYSETMKQMAGELAALTENTFLADPAQWINWARQQHNGTFNPKNYPGCSLDGNGEVVFDTETFKAAMRKRIYLRAEPLPVPDAEQFSTAVSALLGTDIESVNMRVRDAGVEAQRELMRRLIEPVQAMATKLAEQPKGEAKDIRFKDTLVENIAEIVELAPKLNLGGDPQIDIFAKEMAKLIQVSPETLRKDKDIRKSVQADAAAMLEKLSGYKL